MWLNVLIAVAIIIAIAAPIAFFLWREDSIDRRHINAVATTIQGPQCQGRVAWNGCSWGIDANPPEFSDAGYILRCADCGAEVYLNRKYEIVNDPLKSQCESLTSKS